MKHVNFKAFASLAAIASLAGAPALAQQPAMPQQSQPQVAPVSDAEISRFAVANEKVAAIATDMNRKLADADSQDVANKIQMDAQKEMVTVIGSEGLSPKRYNEIIRLAQVDPEVGQKVQSALEG